MTNSGIRQVWRNTAEPKGLGPHVPDRDLEKQADRADNAVGIEKPRGFQRGVFL